MILQRLRVLAVLLAMVQGMLGAHAQGSASAPKLTTQGQQAIAQGLLANYSGDLDAMLMVSKHADHAVLAWAAYDIAADRPGTGQSRDVLASELAVARGWQDISAEISGGTSSKSSDSLRRDNRIYGDTVARVFRRGGEVVVAFRGSSVFGDWLTNATFAVPPITSGQVLGAIEIALEVDEWTQKTSDAEGRGIGIAFVGHSLGGRLAQIARLAVDENAVVFNSSPLGQLDLATVQQALLERPGLMSIDDLRKRLRATADLFSTVTRFRAPQDPLTTVFPHTENVEVKNITEAKLIEGFTKQNWASGVLVDGLPLPDLATAGSTALAVQESIYLQYTHSMEVLARAMDEVGTSVEDDSINAILADPNCLLSVAGAGRSQRCPEKLKAAPRFLTSETDCWEMMCGRGDRWKALADVPVYGEMPKGAPGSQFQAMSTLASVRSGDLITIESAYSIGRRWPVRLSDGTWVFIYSGSYECFTAWIGGAAQVSCDVAPDTVMYPWSDEIWARAKLENGSVGFVPLSSSGFDPDHWLTSPDLYSQLVQAIVESYKRPDGKSGGPKSKLELEKVLAEVDRQLNDGADLNGFSHQGTIENAIDFSQDLELAVALHNRGWTGCNRSEFWSETARTACARISANAKSGDAVAPDLLVGAYVREGISCEQASNSSLMFWNGEFFSAGRMTNQYPVYVSPGRFAATTQNFETRQVEVASIQVFDQREYAIWGARYRFCPDTALPTIWRNSTPMRGAQEPDAYRSRYPGLFTLLDQITDVAGREVAKQSVSELLKFYGSQELFEKLVRFGLTPETAADAAAGAMEQSLISAGSDLATSIALSLATEAGAKAFADLIFSAPKVRDLPREWRVPLYALTEAAVVAIVDTTLGIAEIPSKGPIVLVGPVLDRIYDAQEIYQASRGVAEARTLALYSIAQGAELTAELAATYPGEPTDKIVEQWKADTFKLVASTFTNDDTHEINAIIEDAFETLSYQKGGFLGDGIDEVRRLKRLGPVDSGAGSLSLAHPVDSLVKILSGMDPVETMREAFLRGTSLSEIPSTPDADAGDWHDQAIPNVRLKPDDRYGSFQYKTDGEILFGGRPLFHQKRPRDTELHIYLSPGRNWTYVVARDLDRGGVESAVINIGASVYSGGGGAYRPSVFQPYPAQRTRDYCHFLHDGVAWSPDETHLALKCLVVEGSIELGLLDLKSKAFKVFTPAWGVFPRWGDPQYAEQLRRTKDRWMLWGPDLSTLRLESDATLRVRFDRQRCAKEYSDADCWGGWEETSRPVWETVTLPR